MSTGKTEHIALFVDLENFFGYCNGLGLPIDLGPELEKLTEIGKVTVRKSFGDIQKLPIAGDKKQEIRKMLQQNLINHEDIPYHNAFKNSADIRLVIEALSMVFSNDDIDLVAVVGSDRDYLPLFSKLREIGKEIIGIGGSKDNTPEIYVKACDYFFYHENLIGIAPMSGNAAIIMEPAPAYHSETETEIVAPKEEPTQNYNIHDEGIALLIDALKTLEAKGNEEIVGAAVLPTMRRLKPDFDLALYGYKNFKQLCEKAAEKGVIVMIHNGTKLDLKLVDHSEKPTETAEVASEAKQAVPEPAPVVLRQWIEDKMKVHLPGHSDRMFIFKNLELALKATPMTSLISLSSLVAEKIRKKDVDQAVCYKVLYGLYRANCFSCTQGPTPYNPTVNGFRISVEDYKNLDRSLIKNYMLLYLREHKTPVDPSAWSEVFFKSDSHVEFIKEIAQSM